MADRRPHGAGRPAGLNGFRAVLVDLDGTLARLDGKISKRAREVLQTVQAAGVRVMPVTGRSVASARSVLDGVRIDTPICCYNGAAIYDLASGAWLRNLTIPEEVSRCVLESVRAAGLDYYVYQGEFKFAHSGTHPEYAHLLEELEHVLLVAGPEGIPVADLNRISIFGDEAPLRQHEATIRERHDGRAYLETFPCGAIPSLRRFRAYFCDVQPWCRGKAEALRYLADAHGIAAEQVIAIGDELNDLPMLQAAGLAVAVANAHPRVRAAAAVEIGHHDDDAVAAFLEATFLGS